MSKKANPMMIGVFVVVAVVIAAAGILVLGSGRLFKNARSYVLHFEGDLSGLDAGAPVSFLGVKVGQVSDVSIVYDHATDKVSRPVTIELLEDTFVQRNTDQAGEAGTAMPRHVQRGLRARLASQSLVTGKLKISLGYFPDIEATFRETDPELQEIPTIPAVFDGLAQRIEDLPLEEIVLDVREATQALSALLKSGEIERTLDGLNEVMASIKGVVEAPEWKDALASVDDTMEGVSELLQSDAFGGLMASIDDTLKESHALMRQVQENADPLRRELLVAIEGVVDAMAAAKSFLEYLERHPEAMIHGKGNE